MAPPHGFTPAIFESAIDLMICDWKRSIELLEGKKSEEV